MSTVDRNTHLLDWLSDGYTHCQHGTKEWCEAYLHNAREVIKAQDDALAAKDTALAEITKERDEARASWKQAVDLYEMEVARVDPALAALAEMAGELERTRVELGETLLVLGATEQNCAAALAEMRVELERVTTALEPFKEIAKNEIRKDEDDRTKIPVRIGFVRAAARALGRTSLKDGG